MTDREWRAAFWRREGVPYVAIARDYGLQCLRSKAHKMGFRRLARRGSSPY